MKHRLTFKDDKSDKFWNIEVDETSFTVTYGKTGTSGQTQTKTFDNEEKCLKEAEKLLSEKLKKGYVEGDALGVENGSEDFFQTWISLRDAENLSEALTTHFSYLADMPGFDAILKKIMQQAENITILEAERKFTVNFGKKLLHAFEPEANPESAWPQSFKKIVAVHSILEFGDKNALLDPDFVLGDSGSFDESFLTDEEILESDTEILSPMVDDCSDWWIYHPSEKNALGEPALCFVSHESASVEPPEEWNIGALFLKRLAETLKLDINAEIDVATSERREETNTLALAYELPLEIKIRATSVIDSDTIAVLSRYQEGDNLLFSLLNTAAPDSIETLGQIEVPSYGYSLVSPPQIKISGSRAVLNIGSLASVIKPLCYIDFSQPASIVVSEKISNTTDNAAICKDRIFYDDENRKLALFDIYTKKIETFDTVPKRTKCLAISEKIAVAQTQEEIFIFDATFKKKKQIKFRAAFMMVEIFDTEKIVLSMDNHYYGLCVLDIGSATPRKVFPQEFKDQRFEQYHRIGSDLWALSYHKKKEKWSLIRVRVQSGGYNTKFWDLQNYPDDGAKALQIHGNEARIYFWDKVLVYTGIAT
ncbi:WGR domain protein [Leptospira santarosai str. CBC523]|uniref:WGR domain-containing protein n=1 Tax=Leptospira santarosai TaxID=28183 RepID=UPI0002BED545|nr:WGR domain-containing protein [Leptospira santarosai]EMO14744.1 WGR domain protein [Leptospira santarosai str. CBC523]